MTEAEFEEKLSKIEHEADRQVKQIKEQMDLELAEFEARKRRPDDLAGLYEDEG